MISKDSERPTMAVFFMGIVGRDYSNFVNEAIQHLLVRIIVEGTTRPETTSLPLLET